MVAKILGAQRDFSFGEVDVALKRSDEHPARKAGLRQMANYRILNSGSIQNRPGRSALYPITNGCTRTEEFTIAAGVTYKIAFGNGRVQFINSVGVVVNEFTTTASLVPLPWTTTTAKDVDYAVLNSSVYLTFPGMRPQVYTYDGVTSWTVADYNELISGSSQKRTIFYRISPKNITIQPSATSGSVTVTFSSPIAVPGMVGTYIRYSQRQIVLTGFTDSQHMTGTVVEPLPPGQSLAIAGAIGIFSIGDVVIGSSSGAEGIVINSPNQQIIQLVGLSGSIFVGSSITGGTSGATGTITGISGPSFNLTVYIALSTGTAFVNGETVSGPGWSGTTNSVSPTQLIVQVIQTASLQIRIFNTSDTVIGPSATCTVTTATQISPQAISIWDEEVMNSFRGFPASVFVDQFRLGFCNFPAVPGGISWSAINSPTDLYVDAFPSSAMFELAPSKVQVLYVVPGPEGAEFVFCDRKIYYIPISPTNPLKPGSVAFQLISSDGSAKVKPRVSQEVILYSNAGQNSMMAIIATGAYFRPFNTKNLSEYHAHLFNGITAIAVPTADGTFNERYAYVLNGDGTIAVGKYNLQNILSEASPAIGWGPYSGSAVVSWIAAWQADVLFTSSYFGTLICEILDDTQYLDAALPVNALPAPFTPPGGKGPLWWIPNQTVSLMDQSTRSMGTYQIDANGFIVPQFNGGENLLAASLVAGQPWTAIAEPFCPDASPGQDVGQRMFPRRVARFAVYVERSTGFIMARLFSGPITPTSPALGTIVNNFRVPAWRQGDDPTKPPPLREEAQRSRPLGRSFDPRVAIIKDTPGPLLIAEMGLEATI